MQWWPACPHMLGDGVQAVAVSNLDAVLLEARESLEALPGHLLADMEALLRLRHLQPSGAAEPGELESAVAGAALRDTRRPTAFMPSGRRLALLRRAAQHTMPAPCLMMRWLVLLCMFWLACFTGLADSFFRLIYSVNYWPMCDCNTISGRFSCSKSA